MSAKIFSVLASLSFGSMLLFVSIFFIFAINPTYQNEFCDFGKSIKDFNVEIDNFNLPLLVKNLNLPYSKRNTSVCNWNLEKSPSNPLFLDLSRIILSPDDQFTVTGSIAGQEIFTVFNRTSEIVPGLIHLLPFNAINISLSLSKTDSVIRTFDAVFYPDSNPVELSKHSGLYSFPLNIPRKNKTSTPSIKFALQPDGSYSNRWIMLRFVQTPSDKKIKIKINGDEFSEKNGTLLFLNKQELLNFELDEFPIADKNVFVFEYWLVDSNCSNTILLDHQIPLLYPNENYRQIQSVSEIKCAQLFSKNVANSSFQLLFDSKQTSLANSADSISVYDGKSGSLLDTYTSTNLVYYKTIQNVFDNEQLLIVYDSPFKSDSTVEKFTPPTITLTNVVEYFVLSSKNTEKKASIVSSKEATKVIYTVYSVDDSNQNIALYFDTLKIPMKHMTISVFNSMMNTVEPIVVLTNVTALPTVIRSNAAEMRVEFDGILQDLSFTFKLVQQNKSCNYISTYESTFDIKGSTDGVCSWFIPSPFNDTIIIHPIILNLPVGAELNLTTFNGAKTEVIALKGPINQFHMADFVFHDNNAYEFTYINTNATYQDSHVLISKHYNFLTDSLQSDPISFKSINYPGFYPIGLMQNYIFNATNSSKQTWVTIKDLELAKQHTLMFFYKNGSNSFSGPSIDLSNVPDFYSELPLIIHFNTTSSLTNLLDFSSLFARGFDISFNATSCGQTIDLSKDKKQSAQFGFVPTNVTNGVNSRCIWKVSNGKPSSDTILNVNVTLVSPLSDSKAKLEIFDSISIRSQNQHHPVGTLNKTVGSFLSSINSVIIVYDYSESLATKANYSVQFTVTSEECKQLKYKIKKCETTDRCITEGMYCNGKNDCGDWSDEKYCSGSIPPPPPAPVHCSGVNIFVVLFILIPLSAILAIVGYIFLPPLIGGIRRGRYTQFRDHMSEIN